MRLSGWSFAAALAGALVLGAAAADAETSSFRRGATLVELFNFPATAGEGSNKAYANPAFPNLTTAIASFNFDDLRRLGFDHMRVPIDLGPLMWGDERQRRKIIAQLVSVISELQRHGLGVLVTLNPPSLQGELPETYLDGLNGPKFRRYFEVVERLARELSTLRPGGLLALEPMNEPQSTCRRKTGLDWTAYQEFMVAGIRRVAPELHVFLTGGCWSNIEGIVLLDSDLLRDRRNFVSVHFYYPFLFTHQSATWTMPYLAGTIGVPYPASKGSMDLTLALTRERFKTGEIPATVDRKAALQKAETEIRRYFYESQDRSWIERWMRQVADWQRRERVDADRIVFTEFGAMKQKIAGVEIGKDSREQWLHDASHAIEGNGWGWTVYVLRDDPFGLYAQPTDRYPDANLLRSLRLSVPAGIRHSAR